MTIPWDLHKKMWPEELLYWRRMNSLDVTNYHKRPPKEQLVLFVWGVIEGYGKLPLGTDTMLAAVVADEVAWRLREEHHIQPIIFDIFKDIGCPSATWKFAGSIGYTSSPVPIIPSLWEQTITRMLADGLRRFCLINGDGGNWNSHFAQLSWFPDIREKVLQVGGIFDGYDWAADMPIPGFHGGTVPTALLAWMLRYAPERIRYSALRHGLKSPSAAELREIDRTDMRFLEEPPYVNRYWSEHKQQQILRGTVEFSVQEYRSLVLEADDSTPRKKGGIGEAFETMMDGLVQRILSSLKT